jgi:signal transduction histidine kinase
MSEHLAVTYTILVVDDDPDALEIARLQLERSGHHVLLASSAEEAIAIFLANEVHLLVVDYVMPGMDGAQLVRAIRGFDPFIQIIIQTAHAAQQPSQQVLDDLDIQGYHDKSDGAQRLMAWVTVCLRASRLIRRLRQRERAQGELISNLSHEFRTPLAVTHGYVGLLLEDAFGPIPAEARVPLRAMDQKVRELCGIIDNVLEHVRLEAGAAELSLGGVDLHPLLGELRRLAGPLLQERPVTLSIDVDAELPIVQSDGEKLRTILRNLVSNAVKFTEQGTIAVHASRRGELLMITVQDTGIGIRSDHLDSIFEPFLQGDGSSTRRHGGLGLGLALSRQYARLLGGDLTITSQPGKGTTVTLTVPALAGVTSMATPEAGVGCAAARPVASDADGTSPVRELVDLVQRLSDRLLPSGLASASPPTIVGWALAVLRDVTR